MADARAGKFDCLLVWKLDGFGQSLSGLPQQHPHFGGERRPVHRRHPESGHGREEPGVRFLLHVLGAAAEFERSLIRERTRAGQQRYKQDYESGKVGRTVYSRSGRNLPPHRLRKIFDQDQVLRLGKRGLSMREIAKKLGLGLGTVTRTLRERSKRS